MQRGESAPRHDLRSLWPANLPADGANDRWNGYADVERMGSRGRARLLAPRYRFRENSAWRAIKIKNHAHRRVIPGTRRTPGRSGSARQYSSLVDDRAWALSAPSH